MAQQYFSIDPSHETKAPLDTSEVVFGVKTCKKFHQERTIFTLCYLLLQLKQACVRPVPVLRTTWATAQAGLRLLFYSDAEDTDVSTVVLPVEHVDRGFCSKTMGILRHALTSQRTPAKWLVIADDDTLLSVNRLLQFLPCQDPTRPLALGQRYGYLAALDHGYNYPTGGAGMILSWPAVQALAAGCHCPEPDSPDDMVLGHCLRHLGIPLLHVPLMHQVGCSGTTD
ncbi:B3GALTL [Cordylochernes scorpioides]|uniref:B3GALTL n=1 Tax=Cordylochernes scorpioides TaxID=51811 RepID=A0ABY6K2M2_9ARAC|nr:B3GALTL [Cordylochernes scorpioides]